MHNNSSLSLNSSVDDITGEKLLRRNDQEVINLPFVSPGSHLNMIKTEKNVAIWDKIGTSFQRKRLILIG